MPPNLEPYLVMSIAEPGSMDLKTHLERDHLLTQLAHNGCDGQQACELVSLLNTSLPKRCAERATVQYACHAAPPTTSPLEARLDCASSSGSGSIGIINASYGAKASEH